MINKGDKYTCCCCKGEFTSPWSDEEAMVESEELFGEVAKESLSVICDYCFKENNIRVQCLELDDNFTEEDNRTEEIWRKGLEEVRKDSDRLRDGFWKLIETAPKDGTEILIVNGEGLIYHEHTYSKQIAVVSWLSNKWISTSCCDYYTCFEPTHWQELPELPK